MYDFFLADTNIVGIEEVEVAVPKAHEVRIKILYTGVYVTKHVTIRFFLD